VPFCQPADHTAANVKGTGLSLVITKAIIECMGGNIDFESIENEYTRFFFKV
jgi:signal transduction histidine kinase